MPKEVKKTPTLTFVILKRKKTPKCVLLFANKILVSSEKTKLPKTLASGEHSKCF